MRQVVVKTVLEIVDLSYKYLKDKGIEKPRRQAEELIATILGLKRIDLYLQFDRPLMEQELSCCRQALLRKALKEPIQYIRGEVEFLDAKIKVNRNVLIPRQETEILADHVCRCLSTQDLTGKMLWDICTGSGCLAIAIKKRFPGLTVEASDISQEALSLARENAKNNDCEVRFHQGSLFAPFIGRQAHFIISNPPYVSEKEYLDLEEEVRLYEPKLALVGGVTGYEFYQAIAKECDGCLAPGGKLWLEFGYTQAGKLLELFQHRGTIQKDWSGHDRFFFIDKKRSDEV